MTKTRTFTPEEVKILCEALRLHIEMHDSNGDTMLDVEKDFEFVRRYRADAGRLLMRLED